MRRTAKFLLEAIALLAAGIAILSVFLTIRLASGPLSVRFFTPYIVQALEPDDGSLSVELQDTILTWDGRGRALQLRAMGVRVADANGQVKAQLPELTVGLSVRALLLGRFEPTSLEVVGLHLVLTRDADGEIQLTEALPDVATTPEHEALGQGGADVLRKIVKYILTPPDRYANLVFLTSFTLLDADITLVDRKFDVTWRAASVTLVALRGDANIRLRGTFGLDMGGETANFAIDGTYDIERGDIAAKLDLKEIAPSLFTARVPLLAPLAGAKLPISGSLRINADLGGTISRAEFDIVGGAGSVDLPWERQGQGMSVRSLVLRGAFTNNFSIADLGQFTLAIGPEEQGTVIDVRLTADGEQSGVLGGPFKLNADVAVKALPLADLKRYWPPGASKNSREWVMENMIEGRLGQARVTLNGAAGAEGIESFKPDSLVGTFNYTDIALRYFQPLPILTKVRGTATVNLGGLSFAITGGETNGVQLDSGKVDIIGLDGDNESIAVEAAARGGMRQILEILDRPLLGYAKELGINPRDAGGDAAIGMAIRFPLLNNLTLKQVEISASATSRGLSLPKVALDQDLTEGAFNLQLDGKGMHVIGAAKLGGTPTTIAWSETFNARDMQRKLVVQADLNDVARKAIGLEFGDMVTGPVGVVATLTETPQKVKSLAVTGDLANAVLALTPIGWSKVAGVPGTFKADIALAEEKLTAIRSFAVDAADLHAAGSAMFSGDGKLASVRLDRMIYSNSDFAADVVLQSAGDFNVVLMGNTLDVEPFFKLNGEKAADPSSLPLEEPPPLSIKLAVDTLRLGNGGGLTGVTGTLRREGKLWHNIAIDGNPAPGKSFAFRLLPDGANRRVVVQSDDAGSVLKALDVSEGFIGGKLSIEGLYDDSQAAKGDPPLTGHAQIENFHLINAPGLAKLLSVASLTGILNILRGDGISFDRFDAPFVLKDDVFFTKATKMNGPSLGFTAEGWVSFPGDTLALRGTVVPAYTINSVLGHIPLFGGLLTGADGSGVFAATYRMTGKLGDPDVSVNPLATLTPGFLRGLFGILERDMPLLGADPAEREALPPKSPIGVRN